MSRFREIMVGVDQLANAILGGYSCETLSARCWRLRRYQPYRFFRPVIDVLFFWQPRHCQASYDALVARLNQPVEYSNIFSNQPPPGGFSLLRDVMAEPTTVASGVLIKIFGVPVLASAIATTLGFLLMWPKSLKEAGIRFLCTLLSSFTLGPVLVVAVRSWWPDLFESARHIAVMYGADPALGFLFIAAPVMVVAGMPAWLILGACVRWFDKRRELDIGELAVDAATIVHDVRGAL